MNCRVHHICKSDIKKNISVGDVVIRTQEDLKMRELVSVMKNDNDEKVIINDLTYGTSFHGRGITITSAIPLKLLYVESFIAAYDWSVRTISLEARTTIKFNIIGETCPEYFSPRRYEMFKLIVKEGDLVYDVCVLKSGDLRIYPKGSFTNWLADKANSRYKRGLDYDIPVKDHGWEFAPYLSSRSKIPVCDKHISGTDVLGRLNLIGETSDIITVDEAIRRVFLDEDDDQRINPKDLVIVGETPPEVWECRSKIDAAVSSYLRHRTAQ